MAEVITYGITIDFKQLDAGITSMSQVVDYKNARKEISKVLTVARKEVEQSAKSALPNDPRNAYKGVGKLVWNRGLMGGNINILQPKKAGAGADFQKPRGGRSGIKRNRVRSKRTIEMESYRGKDRAFILRFLNEGTPGERMAGKKSGTMKQANRGHITGKQWFKPAADAAVKKASENFAKEIERQAVQKFNDGKMVS